MHYNVILMSGKGQRFIDEGYLIPKPLLEVNGSMMFENSMKNLPDCDMWIFSINNDILKSEKFNQFIKHFQHPYEVVHIDETTNGQATSCLLAVEKLNEQDSFFVSSCDVILDQKLNITDFGNSDVALVTKEPTSTQLNNSSSYGWLQSNNGKTTVICKGEPNLSLNPFVIVGSFFFSKKSIFTKGYEKIESNNLFINNELYIDVLVSELIADNFKFQNIIDNSIIIGTPLEYENYQTIKGE